MFIIIYNPPHPHPHPFHPILNLYISYSKWTGSGARLYANVPLLLLLLLLVFLCACKRALSLSSAQHQHLTDECAQKRKGRRTEKERGRGDILDKGYDKSMTIMELRWWRTSDLRKRTVEIWQWIQTKGWSWLLFFILLYPRFAFQYNTWTLKASRGSEPRMSRKVKSGFSVCATGNKTRRFSRMATKDILHEALNWWKKMNTSCEALPLDHCEISKMISSSFFLFFFFFSQWWCSRIEARLDSNIESLILVNYSLVT